MGKKQKKNSKTNTGQLGLLKTRSSSISIHLLFINLFTYKSLELNKPKSYQRYIFNIKQMADIAMLMAEEYEKMMKKMSSDHNEDLGDHQFYSSSSVWIIKKPKLKKLVHEPKSKIGHATINGLFSP